MGWFPDCCCCFCTAAMRLIMPLPSVGMPTSGQPWKWNCRTARALFSWKYGEWHKEHVLCVECIDFCAFSTPYPVIGDQEVTHGVTLVLLLPFYLDGDVSVDHCPIAGPILGAFFLQKRDMLQLLWLNRGYWRPPNVHMHHPTCPLSSSSVSMTMEQLLHSHIILQKSSMVCCRGPWLAM